MSARHTAGPWFALDQRASTLRDLGWEGPAHDAILISSIPPSEISKENCDGIVARIEFRNRAEELGEGNMADARLIAAAPELLVKLEGLLEYVERFCSESSPSDAPVSDAVAAIARARGQ